MQTFLTMLGGFIVLCGVAQASEQTFAVISDINGRYGSTEYHGRVSEAISTITELRPGLVISAGDMIAGQKQPKLDRPWLDEMWHNFELTVMDPLASAGIPLLPTVGNHDGSAFNGFSLERERYRAHWDSHQHNLDLLAGSDWPRRYAVMNDEVLLITFDGTRPGKLPDLERKFIEKSLQAHAAKATAIIVWSHLPMWPLAKGRESEIIDDDDLLKLLHHHGVDVYVSGHHHVFYPGVDDAGMIHLGVAALGGNARSFSGGGARQKHGYALLHIDDSSIRVEVRSAPSFDIENENDREGLPPAISGSLGTLRRLGGPISIRQKRIPPYSD